MNSYIVERPLDVQGIKTGIKTHRIIITDVSNYIHKDLESMIIISLCYSCWSAQAIRIAVNKLSEQLHELT